MNAALRAAALVLLLALYAPCAASAQGLPSEPIVFADGHVTLGGNVSVSIAPKDTGFFNYTDYERSALRMLQLDLTAAVKANGHFTLLGDIRSENLDSPRPYGLYLRIRPWTDRSFDIQVGRVPPTFGRFSRRAYTTDNPLIGYPLGYQYLTSLRPDSLPANADELIRMRGRGWLANYSVGNPLPYHGLPLASGFTWDTGVQVHAGSSLLDVIGSVTSGTISNPLFRDDNSGRSVAGRVELHPVAGLLIGASGTHGPFVTSAAAAAAVGDPNNTDFTQTAWGSDVEYSRDYYLIRFESIWSAWRVPQLGAPVIDSPLRALATSVEGRYKLRPGLYVAARVDHLGFSEVVGTQRTATWDAPVTRTEVGGGYSIQRNLVLKLALQYNTRDGGRVHTLLLPAAQLQFWF